MTARPRIRREYPPEVPPVRRRELVAWAFFDFANSGYTTVVITAVFNAYFVAVVVAGAAWATLAWTLALSVSYAFVIATAPALGAYADQHARKKLLLQSSTLLCVVGTAALAWCGAGDVGLALLLVVVSNTAFGTGENLIAAFLPELAHKQAMGRLSGYGWALGYVGGLLVLASCLYWIQSAPARGSSTGQAVPQTMLITAVLFALAALPTFALLRERARRASQPARGLFRTSWRKVLRAFRGSHDLVDLMRFLACIVCYQAGVGTVIAIAAIYTTEALGFTTADSIKLILVVNVTAAAGALAFGFVQDKLGHRRTLAITLLAWLLALAVLWASQSRAVVWLAANLAGLCLGASQSAGRALVGYLCPLEREAEIFGLWGLAVKLAMIVGPLSYGFVSWVSGGDHRIALLATSLFFVGGLVLLYRVDVERGHRAAGTTVA
jgi:UMF1 family MFS transporter